MPCWVTVNCVTPFTVTAPVRYCELGFAATVIPNVEGFDVPPPNEMVIHGTSDVAAFRQLVGVPEAEKLRLSPWAFAVAELGLKLTDVQVCPSTPPPARHTAATAKITRKGIRTLKHSLWRKVAILAVDLAGETCMKKYKIAERFVRQQVSLS